MNSKNEKRIICKNIKNVSDLCEEIQDSLYQEKSYRNFLIIQNDYCCQKDSAFKNSSILPKILHQKDNLKYCNLVSIRPAIKVKLKNEKISLFNLRNKKIIEEIAIQKPEILCYIISLGIYIYEGKQVLKFYSPNLGLDLIDIAKDRLGSKIIRRKTSSGKIIYKAHKLALDNYSLTEIGKFLYLEMVKFRVSKQLLEKKGLINDYNQNNITIFNLTSLLFNFKMEYTYENFRKMFWTHFTFKKELAKKSKSKIFEIFKENPLLELPENNKVMQKSGYHVEIYYNDNIYIIIEIYCANCNNFIKRNYSLKKLIFDYYNYPKNIIIKCEKCSKLVHFPPDLSNFDLRPLYNPKSWIEYHFNKICNKWNINLPLQNSIIKDQKNKGNYIKIEYEIEKDFFYPILTIFCNDCKHKTFYKCINFLKSKNDIILECSNIHCKKVFYIKYNLLKFKWIMKKNPKSSQGKMTNNRINYPFIDKSIRRIKILKTIKKYDKNLNDIFSTLIQNNPEVIKSYLGEIRNCHNNDETRLKLKKFLAKDLRQLINQGFIEHYKKFLHKRKNGNFIRFFSITLEGKKYLDKL